MPLHIPTGNVICPKCNGEGYTEWLTRWHQYKSATCEECSGWGYVEAVTIEAEDDEEEE